jgi:glycosyltransferase involved in cell wall biosynthesis
VAIQYNQKDCGTWICCQLGAREHYAVARALHRQGVLDQLLTDLWLRPENPLRLLHASLRSRFHDELATANVYAPAFGRMAFELRASVLELGDWSRIIERNKWFQKVVVARLRSLNLDDRPRTFLAYSYAALDIFRWAQARGWKTVLAQIDPGPREDRIVSKLYDSHPVCKGHFKRPPAEYWASWHEECAQADRIVVNSAWSREALVAEGLPANKIRIVPLSYETAGTRSFRREYPRAFTSSRPLRVLFLGQINLRKGIGPLLEAIRILQQEPVEFVFVGPIQIPLPRDLRNDPRVFWVGAVPHNQAAKFYRDADVFIFPTFSDGFGLTQLEAQAWKLPIICTKFCGDVVKDGRNGWVLPTITPEAIAAAIRLCYSEPARLKESSDNAVAHRFDLDVVGTNWMNVLE